MKRVLFALVSFVVLALGACGGDDDGPEDTLGAITPVGTKEVTPTPAGGSAGDAPAPPVPGLDEELTLFHESMFEVLIAAGGSFELDPVALASEVGTPPSCDNFQFGFGWQVTDPYPPDGVVLTWQFEREGSFVDIASGPAGSQATGCDVLNAVNGGPTDITVALHCIIGGR